MKNSTRQAGVVSSYALSKSQEATGKENKKPFISSGNITVEVKQVEEGTKHKNSRPK